MSTIMSFKNQQSIHIIIYQIKQVDKDQKFLVTKTRENANTKQKTRLENLVF